MNGAADLNSKDRAGGAETVTSEKSRDVINAFLLRAVVGSIDQRKKVARGDRNSAQLVKIESECDRGAEINFAATGKTVASCHCNGIIYQLSVSNGAGEVADVNR